MNKKFNNAVVFICKAKPHRGGGGLGVAFNFLQGFSDPRIFGSDTDVWFMVGENLSAPPPPNTSADDFLSCIDPGLKQGAYLNFHQTLSLRRLSKEYQKIVIVGFSPFYFWPFLCAGLKNLITVHIEQGKGGRHNELAEERGYFSWREHFVRWCVGFNFRFPFRVVFPSSGALNLFTQKNPHLKQQAESKTKIVYNGVATCEAPPTRVHSGPLKIASVAHHVREKGLDTMIHALHLTSEAGVEWNFINYGQKTNLTEELHTLVTDLGISRRVNFAGLKPQAEVREYLETSDVFLHTPVIVVFDLSLLEAMMHAIPVVTTPLEGNREALGVDYPLYAGTAEEVAERLRWIADHREEAHRIGLALRERALRLFTNEAMVGQYAALVRSLLG